MKHRKHGKYTNDKRRRNRSPKLLKKVVVGFFCALVIMAVVLSAVYLWHLRFVTDTSCINVCFQQETLSITWNPSFKMDACRLSRYDEGTGEYVSCGQYQNGIIIMDAEETDKEIRLRLQAVRYVKIFGYRMELLGGSRELTINPMEMVEVHRSVNAEAKTVSINWQEEEGSTYEVFLFDAYGNPQLYSETDSNVVTFDFANDFTIPDRSEPFKAAVRAVCRGEDYVSYGPMSECVLISRNDLLGNSLSLCWEQVEERQYVLSWQESHGKQYEVQQWSEEENQWVGRCSLDWTEEMTYKTDHLPSNTQVRFRVITYDNVEERDREEYRAEPAEVTFHTGMSPLYCTIWPIIPLQIIEDPNGGEILGEVPAGQTLCVLEENGSWFKILYQNRLGYIDSRFCMINLPEYMGDLCEYDITNSVSSIYRVHEYDIPEITGSVVKGYENVCLGSGNYLVPYLYPCTAKLYQATLNAAADGYSLRIYDAFRPNEATRYLYDTVEMLLYDPIIEEDEEDGEGGENEEYGESREDDETAQMPESEVAPDNLQTDAEEVSDGEQPLDGEGLSDGEQPLDGEGLSDGGQPLDAEQGDEEAVEEIYDTYWSIMTDSGRYRLGSFLAQSVSNHNRGIALDLVLIDAVTKENIPMQTEIHDLSWYSVTGQNNENARLLAQYMKGAGYNGLASEWWHFQDDDTRNQIGLNSYLTVGVSIEGWKRDDTGWKYRLKDGSFYRNTTVTIDGQEYLFDAEGYCAREGLEE